MLLPCPLCTVGLRQRITSSEGNYAARLKRKEEAGGEGGEKR